MNNTYLRPPNFSWPAVSHTLKMRVPRLVLNLRGCTSTPTVAMYFFSNSVWISVIIRAYRMMVSERDRQKAFNKFTYHQWDVSWQRWSYQHLHHRLEGAWKWERFVAAESEIKYYYYYYYKSIIIIIIVIHRERKGERSINEHVYIIIMELWIAIHTILGVLRMNLFAFLFVCVNPRNHTGITLSFAFLNIPWLFTKLLLCIAVQAWPNLASHRSHTALLAVSTSASMVSCVSFDTHLGRGFLQEVHMYISVLVVIIIQMQWLPCIWMI